MLSTCFCNSSSFCKICESKIFEEDEFEVVVESEVNGVPNNSEILFKSSSVAFSLETPDKTEAKSVIDDNEFDELICSKDCAVIFEEVFADFDFSVLLTELFFCNPLLFTEGLEIVGILGIDGIEGDSANKDKLLKLITKRKSEKIKNLALQKFLQRCKAFFDKFKSCCKLTDSFFKATFLLFKTSFFVNFFCLLFH